MVGYVHSFESFGTKDGPGIRFVLFLQGCPLRCLYCHNVDTWNISDKKYMMTPEEVMKEILKVKGFIKSGGVTISGGEPLIQPEFVKELFKLCRKNGIHTAIDTSGYMFNDKVKEVLEYTDLVLLDIKHINPNKYKTLTSVNLKNTLKFAQYLSDINKTVWVRYVLVPGYSDDEEDLHEWAKFVSRFENVIRVDILPFHQMGGYKWKEVGKEYKLENVKTPTKEEIKKAEEIFKSYGLNLGI
ncbi:pyruvate formate lyase-activating protein [Leptotrichia sp. OH3620_COT-345]|uniref:pyruvate formate-lyase-activating protein n=1 Tax=Leptotrichia sp. OH3620_COT-345 TaxID=2491048 RepID=UPI000F65134F|nr:pyruvate formate-lyase-activating protein [Leptotrichia sp. OH3620_COT-345]RRD40446.1 pyruvate formate lyase-activating protein [Leptotrichia sp. OH3620_COT-345]